MSKYKKSILKHKFLTLGVVNVAMLGVVFMLFEIILRILGLGYSNAPFEGSKILHHVHPKNFSFTIHDMAGEFEKKASVHYDHEGLRFNPEKNTNKTPISGDLLKIAFMGDSYVESNQVAWENSFIGKVEQKLDGQGVVKNYGVGSYSPILNYLQWINSGKFFHSDYVFYLLYSNDPRDDQDYFNQAVFDKNGEISGVPGPGNAVVDLMRRSYLIRYLRKMWLTYKYTRDHKNEQIEEHLSVGGFVEENPGVTELTSTYILKLKNAVEENGAQFLLSAVPSKYRHQRLVVDDGPEFAQLWQAWADSNQVTYVDLVEPFEKEAAIGNNLFFEKDIHFNKKGHSVVANELWKALEIEFAQNN